MPDANILLILPDTDVSQRIEHDALFPAGTIVNVVRNRRLAEAALGAHLPDLILLGETLEDDSGINLALSLREHCPQIPLILVPNLHSKLSVLEALRMGFTDVLSLPINASEVTQAVQRVLERSRRLRVWMDSEMQQSTNSLKQQLEAQVAARSRLETILTRVEEAVIITNPDGRLVLANPAARQAFGLTCEDSLGKPVSETIPNQDLLEILGENGSGKSQHAEIFLEDGRVLNTQVTAIPEVGQVVTMQDISHLKELDHIKTDFVNTVSHDLRSPLTAILGYVELLERVGPVNDNQREFIRRIEMSVHSITALINDLLDLGRIEAGFDARKEVVSLAEIVQYTVDGLYKRIADKALSLSVEMPASLPPVRGNPVRLRQMVGNLVGNAVNYTQAGGTIGIHARAEDGQVILQVSDNGPGIPPGEQAYIFDKFFRGTNIPADSIGTGLGLAIVKSIVENHQGRIWVESTFGQGTTFTVVLPIFSQK